MKIKNILHAAALRLCLLAIAMGAVSMAYAQTYDHNTSGSGNIDLGSLNAVSSLYISADESFPNYINKDGATQTGLAPSTYYDGDTWYKYGGDRAVKTPDSGNHWFDWKKDHAIVFKLENGTYNITVKFKNGNLSNSTVPYISVYSGNSYVASDENNGYILLGTNAFDSYTKQITVDANNQYWWVTEKNGNTIRFNSIRVEKVEDPTAPDLQAITSPYFWYYNGGGSFSDHWYKYDSGNNSYRHLPNKNNDGDGVVYASMSKEENAEDVRYVYINGDVIGGDSNNQNKNEDETPYNQYGSYIFRNGDAIGVKLDNTRDYRIKVYVYDRDNKSATPDKNKVLYKGVNVETATRVDDNVSQQTIKKKESGDPTTTRLITYEIDKAKAGVYWIKNAIDEDLNIGGFEVLPKDYPDITKSFTGSSWFVEDNKRNKSTALSDTQTVDYVVSGNNVVVYGPAMAINSYTQSNGEEDASSHQTVMVNNGSKIGVRLPKGATIKFRYTADNEASGIELIGVSSYTTNKYVTLYGTIEYKNETGAAQEIWITGKSTAYAYFYGFEVTQPEPVNHTTLQPIDENYIYYIDGVPTSGVQNTGDCEGRVKFVDTGNNASINYGSKMSVLGKDVNPLEIENVSDAFAIKVDQGPGGVKTGYIKVYFNGGNSASHQMEELPLDEPMYSGWNSTYEPSTRTITFTDGGGRGWWFGTGENARNLSGYNKLNIEIESVTGYTGDAPALQAIIQSAGDGTLPGLARYIDIDSSTGRIIGDIPGRYEQEVTLSDGTKEMRVFDPAHISQIYIGSNKAATVKIKSARLMTKPLVIAKGTSESGYNSLTDTELFGGKIYDLDANKGGFVYEYPFDLSKEGTSIPQLTWITGAASSQGKINIAAIEVIYDSPHAKVVDWYVNKDTKMIVGSDDPNFTMKDFDGNDLNYPPDYDEYVTFYMSSGRQANVSFIMPEAVREVYDWEHGGKYGKHKIEINNRYNPQSIHMKAEGITYDRNGATRETKNGVTETTKISDDIYQWYGYSYNVPASNKDEVQYYDNNFCAATVITATQVKDGKEYNSEDNNSEDNIDSVDGKLGQWKIYMRFVSYKAPIAVNNSNSVTVEAGQGNTYNIYYTLDSSDPENYGVLAGDAKEHSSTEQYTGGVDVSGKNCIFKAAQYVTTDCYFHEDIAHGKDTTPSNVLKVVSKDLAISNEIPSVVYVKNKITGDAELFNEQDGGYMLTIPTGDVMTGTSKHEQKYNANPFMYLTLGGRDHPYLNGNKFNLCGTNWICSDDSGLKTYLDSYKYKMDVADAENSINGVAWNDGESSQNKNPYTECNGGVGGADTEDGGMFLQPIGGAMLRFEPEYDGVITVWLRQNGCLDNNSQENGKFARRPVYVMDENGRIMRRSTIRPTAEHYMGINGTWSINSSVCEERSQVEHTWLYEVAKQAFANHPVYANRFSDAQNFPNRWETLNHDHSGHILYGWWYKGFDLDATRYRINSAAHVSRFEYMEPQLLYRSDGIYNMEMNTLGLKNSFAKYGYELPNFQYVRYRIPVKAGKTYYIAGRGTKNGFSAIRFDALRPNTNGESWKMNDLRYTDNPVVKENSEKTSADYLKISYDWSKNGSHDYKGDFVSQFDLTGKNETVVKTAYSTLDMITIDEDEKTNTSSINTHLNYNGKKYGMDEYELGNLVGKTVDVELKRTFTKNHWHPIILPFSLSETRVEQYFGVGTKILYLDPYVHTRDNQLDETTGRSFMSALRPALEGTKLSFTIHRYQMLYANTPAFICPTLYWPEDSKKDPAGNVVRNADNMTISNDGNSVSNITFRRVTIDGSNSDNFLSDGTIGYAISQDYEVVGSFDNTPILGDDIYYVTNYSYNNAQGTTAQLIHSKGYDVTMKGTRVWIRPIAGRNAAPIMTVGSRGFSDFEEDSGSTGISDIVADDYTIEGYDIDDDSVYDLLGRKVGHGSLDGLLKGVYIFHGRKVYVK